MSTRWTCPRPSLRGPGLAMQRLANLRWLVGDLLNPALPVKHEGYDVVTALSSVHHMPLQPVLRRLAGLVRPGGVLAVIGFYRQATLTDATLAEIRDVAAGQLHGAHLRRRLDWRYSLLWHLDTALVEDRLAGIDGCPS